MHKTSNPEIGDSILANGINTNYHSMGSGDPVLLGTWAVAAALAEISVTTALAMKVQVRMAMAMLRTLQILMNLKRRTFPILNLMLKTLRDGPPGKHAHRRGRRVHSQCSSKRESRT